MVLSCWLVCWLRSSELRANSVISSPPASGISFGCLLFAYGVQYLESITDDYVTFGRKNIEPFDTTLTSRNRLSVLFANMYAVYTWWVYMHLGPPIAHVPVRTFAFWK